MNKKLKDRLTEIARERQVKGDPSHDFHHVMRVLHLAIKIAKKEKADLEVVIPAILFHDTVVYAKDSPQSVNETDESAEVAGQILADTKFPTEKIEQVKTCIRECSYSKGIMAETIEGKVVQDADRLESVGAISIMRTFASGGQMNRTFYYAEDPFRENTKAEGRVAATGLDLFYSRLLPVGETMRTETGKKMAVRRTKFLHTFLKEFRKELKESGVIKK